MFGTKYFWHGFASKEFCHVQLVVNSSCSDQLLIEWNAISRRRTSNKKRLAQKNGWINSLGEDWNGIHAFNYFSFPFFLLFSFCISCHYNFFLFTHFFFYFFLVWSIVGSCGLCMWSYPRLFTMLCRWARVGLVSTLLHGLSGGVFTGIKVTLAVWLLDGSGRENNRNGAGNNSGLYSRVQWS